MVVEKLRILTYKIGIGGNNVLGGEGAIGRSRVRSVVVAREKAWRPGDVNCNTSKDTWSRVVEISEDIERPLSNLGRAKRDIQLQSSRCLVRGKYYAGDND